MRKEVATARKYDEKYVLIGSASFADPSKKRWVSERELERLAKSIEYTIYQIRRVK